MDYPVQSNQSISKGSGSYENVVTNEEQGHVNPGKKSAENKYEPIQVSVKEYNKGTPGTKLKI